MKLMIASDIHGSFYYTKKIAEIFSSEQADRLVLLGDLLYHGPRNPLPKDYAPSQVFELLNTMKDKILAVRGNCDSEVDQMVLSFPILADYTALFVDGINIFATHGHLFSEDNLPPLQKNDVLIHGHTHVRVLEKRKDYTVINPGSVSLPKDDFQGYTIYESHEFVQKTLNGKVVARLKL